MEKQLHSQFHKNTADKKNPKTYDLYNTSFTNLCFLCGATGKNVTHIRSAYKCLAQKKYGCRRDKVCLSCTNYCLRCTDVRPETIEKVLNAVGKPNIIWVLNSKLIA